MPLIAPSDDGVQARLCRRIVFGQPQRPRRQRPTRFIIAKRKLRFALQCEHSHSFRQRCKRMIRFCGFTPCDQNLRLLQRERLQQVIIRRTLYKAFRLSNQRQRLFIVPLIFDENTPFD